jgi:sulfatase modifying factor 1
VRWAAAAAILALFAAGCSGACGRGRDGDDAGAPASSGPVVTVPSATAPGAPRVGMVWIPSGVLKAGTPVDQVPRIAEEELPATEIAMSGFYIDVLPFPNEAGAIPTTNVTRDDAVRLCGTKGKRLCTELEWERACKGANNTTYEYGEAYQPFICGTGVPAEQGAKRPSGDRVTCKSTFGVREMHGGVWEWTDSEWGRGQRAGLGVLRGGNAVQGEVVGRCANAIARTPQTKSATMGARCCAGPRNDAKVDLVVKMGPILQKLERVEDAPKPIQGMGCASPTGEGCVYEKVWVWHPMGNVEIHIRIGCSGSRTSSRCGGTIVQIAGDKVEVMTKVDSGREIPEFVVVSAEDRRIRMRGSDATGPFFREIVYLYGKVEVRPARF